MTNLEWFDYLRIVTMLLCLLSLHESGKRATKYWKLYSARYQQLWWCFNALLFLLLEGSLEQIILDAGWGPRTLLSFIVSVFCLRAVRSSDEESIF